MGCRESGEWRRLNPAVALKLGALPDTNTVQRTVNGSQGLKGEPQNGPEGVKILR